MKKLSSKTTFFHKTIFPIVWFGGLGFIVAGPILSGRANGSHPMLFIAPAFMIVAGYFIMKKLIFDLADEVYDEGDTLLFIKSGKEVRVRLRDVKNLNYQSMMNPPRVTLSLRHETILGSELSFSPTASLVPFRKNKDIEELIDRIDRAKG